MRAGWLIGCDGAHSLTAPASGGPPTWRRSSAWRRSAGRAGMKLADPTLLAAFRCYRRSTEIMRRGRILIAGGAAHVHSPAGGPGHEHRAAARVQPRLEARARRARPDPRARPDLRDPSPAKRRVRDRGLPAVMALPTAERRWMTRLAQLSHNYRGGPLADSAPSFTAGSIASGDRLPSVTGVDLGGERVCHAGPRVARSAPARASQRPRRPHRAARPSRRPRAVFALPGRIVRSRSSCRRARKRPAGGDAYRDTTVSASARPNRLG
jgi:hypothetical protein